MAKMRIYDIARSMQEKLPDIKSKDVVKLLQENGFEAKSAQSVIEDDAIGFLLKHFNKVVAQKAAKKENTKNSKPVKQNKTSNQEHKPKAANTNKKNKRKMRHIHWNQKLQNQKLQNQKQLQQAMRMLRKKMM